MRGCRLPWQPAVLITVVLQQTLPHGERTSSPPLPRRARYLPLFYFYAILSEPRTGALSPFGRYSLCEMARTKWTARASTGGKVPLREITTRAALRFAWVWGENGHDVHERSWHCINREFIYFEDRRNAERRPSLWEHTGAPTSQPCGTRYKKVLRHQVQASRQASIRRGGRVRRRGPTSLRAPCGGVRFCSPGAESLVHPRPLFPAAAHREPRRPDGVLLLRRPRMGRRAGLVLRRRSGLGSPSQGPTRKMLDCYQDIAFSVLRLGKGSGKVYRERLKELRDWYHRCALVLRDGRSLLEAFTSPERGCRHHHVPPGTSTCQGRTAS